MPVESPNLAIVGINFREAPTAWRAAAAACDQGADSPTLKLIAGGFATGVVRIATCSRSEWVVSSTQPKWAAELLLSSLLAAVPEARRHNFHLRSGVSAANYLFRVASGMDSLAEGESAVTRQVLRAFSEAHARKQTDRTLNLAWNELGKLAHHRRRMSLLRPGIGVQRLVLDELREREVKEVALFGLGQIGNGIADLLHAAGIGVRSFRRATLAQFYATLTSAPVVVFASGASAPWCDLPAHPGLAIDVGSPPQIRQRGGFAVIGLDALLSRPGCQMSDTEFERLEALVETQALEFVERLTAPDRRGIGELKEQHASFVHEMLPRLLAAADRPEAVRELRRELQQFTHALVQKARGDTP